MIPYRISPEIFLVISSSDHSRHFSAFSIVALHVLPWDSFRGWSWSFHIFFRELFWASFMDYGFASFVLALIHRGVCFRISNANSSSIILCVTPVLGIPSEFCFAFSLSLHGFLFSEISLRNPTEILLTISSKILSGFLPRFLQEFLPAYSILQYSLGLRFFYG